MSSAMFRWISRDHHASSLRPAGWHAVDAPSARTVFDVRGPGGTNAASRAGLRRVDWVRLSVDDADAPVRAEVMGVGHRLPVACPVPLSVAADLIAAGTPSVVRRLATER